MKKSVLTILALVVAIGLASCATLDLTAVGLDKTVSMTDVIGDDVAYLQLTHFRDKSRAIWLLGFINISEPDVRAALVDNSLAADAVINLEITTQFEFVDWLITYLTLGLLMSRTVEVEGDRVEYR